MVMDKRCDPSIRVVLRMNQQQENRLQSGLRPLIEVAQRAVLTVSTGWQEAALGELCTSMVVKSPSSTCAPG